MKKNLFFILNLLICYLPLNALIIQTTQIDQVVQEVTENSLILFNIAEVLMDSEMSLGTQAWRKYVRTRVSSQLHDELTLYVFKHVPPKTPEQLTAEVIRRMQEKGMSVLAFTSRGRYEWYSSQVAGVDFLTEKLLRQIGIDFSHTHLPSEFSQLDMTFSDYFHGGIIYGTNTYEKGEILVKLLKQTNYRPSKIIFIDDKIDSLINIEAALEKNEIPFMGYAYSCTAKEHEGFDPMIAHIQLDWLISYGQLLSDQKAEQIKNEQFIDLDSEKYFYQLMEKWKTFVH